MSDAEGVIDYLAVLHGCEAVIQVASVRLDLVPHCDLMKALNTVERADQMGPLLDPTSWRERQKDGGLAFQREVIELCLAMKRGIARIRAILPAAKGTA